MNNKRKYPSTDQVTALDAQGLTPERIAALLSADVETVEYILDRAWMHWGARYGYDN